MDIEHYDLCIFGYIFDRIYRIILISYVLHHSRQAVLHYINKGKPKFCRSDGVNQAVIQSNFFLSGWNYETYFVHKLQ